VVALKCIKILQSFLVALSWRERTGGAITSNIYDLLAWAKSGTGDDLLTEEIFQRRHEIRPGGTVYPQYGIALIQLSGEWYGHSGDAFGYSTAAWRDGSSGASFAGALNSCSANLVLEEVWGMFEEELLARETDDISVEPTMTVVPSMTPSPSSSQVSPTGSPGMSPTDPPTSPIGSSPTEQVPSSAASIMKASWSKFVILGSLVVVFV
jgi:hypothetical protein